jgi:hypothetical protein
MAVENRTAPDLRNTLIIIVAGLIGFVVGALGGYLGYSNSVIFRSPLIRLQGTSSDSPLDQTYRGMARFQGLELVARGCNGKPVPPRIIERENQVLDQIEASSRKANLSPPLDVARAIVAYRIAKIANMRSDKRSSGNAIQQGLMFLQAAGWREPSSDRLTTIVRVSDDCQQQGGVPKEQQ